MGHRDIGFFCNSIETVPSEHERFKGYCQAHVAAGLSLKRELVYRRSESLDNPVDMFDIDEDNRRHYAEAALSYFLSGQVKPTCVVAVNDMLAIALLKAALSRNLRVPADLSITGFDDLHVSAHVEVPLTTVRQPFEKIGAAAASLLLDIVEHKANPSKEIRILPETVFRQSANSIEAGARQDVEPVPPSRDYESRVGSNR